MKLSEFTIENFMAIGNAKLNLANRGLMMVEGVNADDTSADSNGSGKSSIVDALCWALYGTTARGETGDAVVNNVAKKGTLVSIRIEDDGDDILISRHRKHKTFKNSLTVSVNGKDMTKGTDKGTQEFVTKVLGCTYEVFRAAVYSGQESMPDLPSLTDKNLKILVEEAAGITLIEDAYVIAKKRMSVAKSEVMDLGVEVDRIESSIVSLEEGLKDQEQAREGWSDQRKARAVPIVDNVRRCIKERQELGEQIKAFELKDCDHKLQQVEDKIASSDAVKAKAKKAHEDYISSNNSLTKRDSDVAAANKALIKEQDARSKIKSDECYVCGGEIDAEVVKRLVQEKDTLVQKAMDWRDEALSLYSACLKETETLKSKSERADKDVPDDSKLIEAKFKIKQAIETNKKRVAEVTALEAREEGYRAQLDAIKKEENPWIGKVEKTKDQIEQLNGERVKKKFDLKSAERLLNTRTLAAEAFSPTGVRAHILDTVTPFLNQRTSDYLSVLSDGNMRAIWNTVSRTASGELREKFNISIESDTGGKTFKLLSGGEKRKVRLAAALALQDLVASRATKPFEIWIGDEIDDALDPAGLERLMTILKDKASSHGTVLVISHNSLRDWISSAFTVTKSGGTSVVSESV